MGRRKRLPQRGFVLAAALWTLAIVAVAAAYFAERIQHTMRMAALAQSRSQALVDMEATRAEILFRMATTPISIFGLGLAPPDAIALDDRPYAGQGNTLLRLQDNRGLLNLNFAGDAQLDRLFSALGVPAANRSALIDTLRDYVDDDNLKRLNGAEASNYATANMPPPRNVYLITPLESRNIFSWKDVAALWKDNLLPRLTCTGSSYLVNPNTAPWQVLASMNGMTPEAAAAILQARKLAPIATQQQIEALTGIAIPSDIFNQQMVTIPSDSTRVTQRAIGMDWGWQYNVKLTPASEAAPWRIEYFYQVELPPAIYGEQVAQSLPKRSTVAPSVAQSLRPFL
jgi:general secretion pathway protein K